jgi:hypothetical protein
MAFYLDPPKKVQAWFNDNYGAWVPDIVIDPKPGFVYRAARGTKFLLVAFTSDNVPMGWVPTEKLGYQTAKDWQEDNGT